MEHDQKNATHKAIDYDWKPVKGENSGDKNWILVVLINLAKELKRHSTTIGEAEVWTTLLKYKEIFKGAQLTEYQIANVIFNTAQELKFDFGICTWLSDDESVELGFQMYEGLLYRPDHQEEAKRLFSFFESLLMDHSLSTVVAAAVNNLETKVGNEIKDYSGMNTWYKTLDARYNFSLGNAVMALSTTEQLVELAKSNPPYLAQYKELANCTDGTKTTCEKLDISGTTN